MQSGRRECASAAPPRLLPLKGSSDSSNSPFGELSRHDRPQRRRRRNPRSRDADRTQQEILAAATAEFAAHGFGGGRIDAIAERAPASTRSSSTTTSRARTSCSSPSSSRPTPTSAPPSASCISEAVTPLQAIESLVVFTWRHYLAHPEFLALLNSENMQSAGHLKRSPRIRQMNSPLIDDLARVLGARRRRASELRRGIDAMQLYISIAGLAYFYLSNKHTLGTIFGRDLMAKNALDERLAHYDRGRRPLRAGLSLRPWTPSTSASTGTRATSPSTACSPRPRWTRWCATSRSGRGLPRRSAGPGSAPGIPTASWRTVLRKLDNPHAHRPAVQQSWSSDPRLVGRVESLLGPGVSVYFSQIFFKPPEGGGPKPAHQDNFYFGPTDIEGVATALIALDDATSRTAASTSATAPTSARSMRTSAPGRRAVQPAAAAGRARQAADDAGAGAKGRRELPSRQHLPSARGRTTAPPGVAPAPCTTCATTSSSPPSPCPTTTDSSSGSPDAAALPQDHHDGDDMRTATSPACCSSQPC